MARLMQQEERYMATQRLIEDLSDETTCSICMEYYKEPVILDCGHNFCRACLTQCWGEREGAPSCPQCREIFQQENFRLNRQLANIVQLVRIHRKGGKLEEKRVICERHQKSLKFFCRDDLIPVCSACVTSRKHWTHRVLPMEEAFLEYRKRFLVQLQFLKQERENLLDKKKSEEQRSRNGLAQLEAERKKCTSAFQQILKLLEEKKGYWLTHLDDLEGEIQKGREENIARISEEISRLSHLITEMEAKCLQSACEFLQDLKNLLNRCERQRIELSLGQEEALRTCAQKTSAIEKAVRICGGLMEEALPQGPLKSALHKVLVPLEPGKAHQGSISSEELRNIRLKRRERNLLHTAQKAEAFEELPRANNCRPTGSGSKQGSMGNKYHGRVSPDKENHQPYSPAGC